jgi:hypothetical protein
VHPKREVHVLGWYSLWILIRIIPKASLHILELFKKARKGSIEQGQRMTRMGFGTLGGVGGRRTLPDPRKGLGGHGCSSAFLVAAQWGRGRSTFLPRHRATPPRGRV